MKLLFALIGICFIHIAQAQMDNRRLEELLTTSVDSISGSSGRWQAMYYGVPLIILTDEKNDRMRIIAPIEEA